MIGMSQLLPLIRSTFLQHRTQDRPPQPLLTFFFWPPHAKTIAILINSDFGPSGRFRSDVEVAARALRLPIEFLQANNEREIDHAFNSLAQPRADALLVGPGPFLDSRRDLLVAHAAKMAIP